jgi:hypothetical protein
MKTRRGNAPTTGHVKAQEHIATACTDSIAGIGVGTTRSRPHTMGAPFFTDTRFRHRRAVRYPHLPELALVLLPHVLELDVQRVLRRVLAVVNSLSLSDDVRSVWLGSDTVGLL